MRKFLTTLLTILVCFVVAPAAFAQTTSDHHVNVSSSAFASGVLPNGDNVNIDLFVDRVDHKTAGASVFTFNFNTFTFSSESRQLNSNEYAFGANANTARLHTSFSPTGAVDIRWRATGPHTPQTVTHVRQDPSSNQMFQFTTQSDFANATVSGDVGGTAFSGNGGLSKSGVNAHFITHN